MGSNLKGKNKNAVEVAVHRFSTVEMFVCKWFGMGEEIWGESSLLLLLFVMRDSSYEKCDEVVVLE